MSAYDRYYDFTEPVQEPQRQYLCGACQGDMPILYWQVLHSYFILLTVVSESFQLLHPHLSSSRTLYMRIHLGADLLLFGRVYRGARDRESWIT